MSIPYDAILVVSFGGPEGMDEVMPFLRNVVKGRNVPDQRLQSVARHYEMFDGVSPINEQMRQLISRLEKLLEDSGPRLPVYWGNRNWHPLVTDTVARMAGDGVRHAVAFVTSAYGSYSGCRLYLENIAAACEAAGEQSPRIDKLRLFYNHPGFIKANVHQLEEAMKEIPSEKRGNCKVVFTAHSIPDAMAESSPYVNQLKETAALIATELNLPEWTLAYQSRSGPPSVPWLEPDILEHIREIHASGARDLVVLPVGFVSDHMEVIYDLDVEAGNLCRELGLNMVRASTAGSRPEFVEMIRDLIVERVEGIEERSSAGEMGAAPDCCPDDCCPQPATKRMAAGDPAKK